MENQKVLWVILSITIAAIIVLIGGLWLLRDDSDQAMGTTYSQTKVPSTGSKGDTNTFAYESPLLKKLGVDQELKDKEDIFSQEYTYGEDETSSAEISPYAESEKESSVTKDKGDASATSKKEHKSGTTTNSTAKPKTEATKTSTSQPRKKTVYVKEYWIQVGSYKNRNRAEMLNSKLSENGFEGRILTNIINGQTYYRVRIGPYTAKQEAEKFLDWVKSLEGMADSYISEVPVKREIIN